MRKDGKKPPRKQLFRGGFLYYPFISVAVGAKPLLLCRRRRPSTRATEKKAAAKPSCTSISLRAGARTAQSYRVSAVIFSSAEVYQKVGVKRETVRMPSPSSSSGTKAPAQEAESPGPESWPPHFEHCPP